MRNNYTLYREISTNSHYGNKTDEASDRAIFTQTSQAFPVALYDHIIVVFNFNLNYVIN